MTDEEIHVLELAMADIDKQYGKGSIVRLGNDNITPWPSIPTGALTLDLILGGGLPRGRIVEIYGPESSGKSTLALSVVAQAQALGETCVYIDAENALDPVYMKAVGINLDDLILSQPSSGEEALDVAERMTRTGLVSVIVVDSVAALVPKEELEGDISDKQMGAQARLMAKGMRKLSGIAADTKTLLLFINQLREKIGVVYGPTETQPGGRALKFYASVRIDIRRKEDLKDKNDGTIIGIKSEVLTRKNKVAPALRRAQFDILFGRGINTFGCIADLAVDKGLIEKKGSWYEYEGQSLGQGRDKLVELLTQDLDLADSLKKRILDGS